MRSRCVVSGCGLAMVAALAVGGCSSGPSAGGTGGAAAGTSATAGRGGTAGGTAGTGGTAVAGGAGGGAGMGGMAGTGGGATGTAGTGGGACTVRYTVEAKQTPASIMLVIDRSASITAAHWSSLGVGLSNLT